MSIVRKIKNKKGNVGIGAAIIICVLLLIVGGIMITCTAKVPAGYVGIVYTMSGGVEDDVLTQGWHLVSPTKHVTLYSVGLETSYLTSGSDGDSGSDESFEASSKEGKALTIDLTFNYQYDQEKVADVFKKFKGQSGTEVRDSFVKPKIISYTKEVVAQYKVADIIGSERANINATLSKYLAEKFEPYGIIISDASLINIGVDAETQQAINNKITATQNQETQAIENQTAIDKAEADAQVAKTNAEAKAEATRIAAEAEAEANIKVAESLTEELIEYEKIQKWNGELPKVSGAASTIVDVGDVVSDKDGE